MDNLYLMILSLPGIFIAMTFHEFAHGLVAYWNGDDTAKCCGRLTLNPIKHIDPAGLIILFLCKFGWANPVPINENNFKSKKIGLLSVSIAGVTMNLIISIITLNLLLFLVKIDLINDASYNVLYLCANINIQFAAFNLMPIPPLDGAKLLYGALPNKLRYLFFEYEKYGIIVLFILSFSGAIRYVLNPIIEILYYLVNAFLIVS